MQDCTCPPHLIISELGFETCRGCGITKVRTNLIVPHVYCASVKLMRPPYCRKKRFDRILSNAYGHRVPRIAPSLVDLIVNEKCKTPAQILSVMK